MAKRKIERYTFANAYIGSFVKNLMSHQDMMRLAGSNDLSAAEAILTEYGYEESKELKDGDIESFIKREQENLHSMIYDTLPDCKETALCFFPFDYHNVKVCLKSEFLGITPSEEYLASTGDLDWKNLVAMIRDRSYDFMPVHMKHAIMEATDLFWKRW